MPVNLLGVALRRLGGTSQPQGGLGPGHSASEKPRSCTGLGGKPRVSQLVVRCRSACLMSLTA